MLPLHFAENIADNLLPLRARRLTKYFEVGSELIVVDGARVVVVDDAALTTSSASKAAPPSQPATTFLGQVVDVATLDPVIDASIQVEDAEVPTDSSGRFDLGRAIDEKTDWLRVMNPHGGTHIRDARRETWRLQGDGSWVIPIAVGPMYRLNVMASGVDADEKWQARVVEVASGEDLVGTVFAELGCNVIAVAAEQNVRSNTT